MRGGGLYLATPGISRARAEDAAAVMGLTCVGCEDVPETCVELREETKGSKKSLSRSNSRNSGAESSVFCSCSNRIFQDVES